MMDIELECQEEVFIKKYLIVIGKNMVEAVLEMVQMSRLSPAMLLGLCGVQLAVIALVLWLHADRLSRRKPRILLGV